MRTSLNIIKYLIDEYKCRNIDWDIKYVYQREYNTLSIDLQERGEVCGADGLAEIKLEIGVDDEQRTLRPTRAGESSKSRLLYDTICTRERGADYELALHVLRHDELAPSRAPAHYNE